MLSNWSMPTDSSDHLSHPQVLPSFFDRKPDRSLRLCVDYRGPYNIPGHVGIDGQDCLEGHDRSYVPRQAGKGLILPGNLFVG